MDGEIQIETTMIGRCDDRKIRRDTKGEDNNTRKIVKKVREKEIEKR